MINSVYLMIAVIQKFVVHPLKIVQFDLPIGARATSANKTKSIQES
jgi:hypothetical protein